MLNNHLIFLLIIASLLIIFERIWPSVKLPQIKGWWLRVILINFLQLLVVVFIHNFFEPLLLNFQVYHFDLGSDWKNGLVGYFVITFVFYWWHRWRHTIRLFWDVFHQIHHSPVRIETVTSFYKHPLEIFVNSLIISVVVFLVLGMDLSSSMWVTFYTGLAELFYHVNIKTPYWMGFIFQRPESHRIHHEKGVHNKNFSDLPLWDMIFGTFENASREVDCGFKDQREQSLLKMLFFKNVNNTNSIK